MLRKLLHLTVTFHLEQREQREGLKSLTDSKYRNCEKITCMRNLSRKDDASGCLWFLTKTPLVCKLKEKKKKTLKQRKEENLMAIVDFDLSVHSSGRVGRGNVLRYIKCSELLSWAVLVRLVCFGFVLLLFRGN